MALSTTKTMARGNGWAWLGLFLLLASASGCAYEVLGKAAPEESSSGEPDPQPDEHFEGEAAAMRLVDGTDPIRHLAYGSSSGLLFASSTYRVWMRDTHDSSTPFVEVAIPHEATEGTGEIVALSAGVQNGFLAWRTAREVRLSRISPAGSVTFEQAFADVEGPVLGAGLTRSCPVFATGQGLLVRTGPDCENDSTTFVWEAFTPSVQWHDPQLITGAAGSFGILVRQDDGSLSAYGGVPGAGFPDFQLPIGASQGLVAQCAEVTGGTRKSVSAVLTATLTEPPTSTWIESESYHGQIALGVTSRGRCVWGPASPRTYVFTDKVACVSCGGGTPQRDFVQFSATAVLDPGEVDVWMAGVRSDGAVGVVPLVTF